MQAEDRELVQAQQQLRQQVKCTGCGSSPSPFSNAFAATVTALGLCVCLCACMCDYFSERVS